MSNLLICEFCDRHFSSKANLKNHVLTARYCLDLQKDGDIKHTNGVECEFCHYKFSHPKNLTRHLKNCALKLHENENNSFKVELDNKIAELNQEKTKYNKLKNTMIKYKTKNAALEQLIKIRDNDIAKQATDIIKLKGDLLFEKGQIAVYQKSKPSKIVNNTNCSTVNSKLSNIQITTIKPFTLEGIAELLPFYTEERFLNKLPGIIATILPFITLNVNGVIERNIVCTDLSRTICHLLSDKREWERDDGLTICSEIIKVFVPKMNEYMDVYNEKFKEADKFIQYASFAFMKTDEYKQCRKDFDTYYELMEDLRPGFYSPASRGNGDDYNGMIKTFRDLLKPAIYVKPDKLLLK